MSVWAKERSEDFDIYTEDAKCLDFCVSVHCSPRIKGPEPEGYSDMEGLCQVAQSTAQACLEFCVISFLFETTRYWRNAAGLHRQWTRG